MRKHNIGRISIVIIALNIIFGLVYLADRNDTSFWTTQTEQEEVIKTDMVITLDTTVNGEYVTMLENIISDQKYNKEALSIVSSYEWYLTDNITNTENYAINDRQIIIYAADDNYVAYVNKILNTIITQ